jgi:hypothetical protein
VSGVSGLSREIQQSILDPKFKIDHTTSSQPRGLKKLNPASLQGYKGLLIISFINVLATQNQHPCPVFPTLLLLGYAISKPCECQKVSVCIEEIP